jgi:phage anti-repressor protein
MLLTASRAGRNTTPNTTRIAAAPSAEPCPLRSRSIGEALPIKGGVIISGDAIETVNARDLHAFLEVGSAFKDWIARRLEEYEFLEGKDFCSFLSATINGRPAKEYAITIDMAKELAMVERNAKGKEARAGS